ncbi:MAG: hypothetical protein QM758_06260 [Armatimonas sp.]
MDESMNYEIIKERLINDRDKAQTSCNAYRCAYYFTSISAIASLLAFICLSVYGFLGHSGQKTPDDAYKYIFKSEIKSNTLSDPDKSFHNNISELSNLKKELSASERLTFNEKSKLTTHIESISTEINNYYLSSKEESLKRESLIEIRKSYLKDWDTRAKLSFLLISSSIIMIIIAYFSTIRWIFYKNIIFHIDYIIDYLYLTSPDKNSTNNIQHNINLSDLSKFLFNLRHSINNPEYAKSYTEEIRKAYENTQGTP